MLVSVALQGMVAVTVYGAVAAAAAMFAINGDLVLVKPLKQSQNVWLI